MKHQKPTPATLQLLNKIPLFLLLIFPVSAFSQEAPHHIEMADKMRADGMIYVVVLVLMTILIGIFITLFYLERRMRKMEKNLEK